MRNVYLSAKEELVKIARYNDTYFFRHSPVEEGDDVKAQEDVAIVPHATYETLVAALVHTHYTADAETAIIANYLADPDNADHRAEFEQYQAWRTEVKTACKEYFNIY